MGRGAAEMTEELWISVVMATYNRAEILAGTLAHLAAQDLAPKHFELVVVDDGSTDRTREVVEGAIATLPFRVTYLHHANQGPGYTQNRGIRKARAPLVLLIADDILLTPEALSRHVAAHHQHSEPGVAVLGRVRQSPLLTGSVFMRTWDPFGFERLRGVRELPYYMFWACNISFKRVFMLDHGMFRAQRGRAGAAAHEDAEVGYRLHRHGLHILYAETALGYHHHVETLEGAMRRAYQRGLNWDEFRALVPEPEIAVRYHVFRRDTVRDHLCALRPRHRRHLFAADKSPLMPIKYLLRSILFNGLAVRRFWLPIFREAERRPMLARGMHRIFYRGVIAREFAKGCRDGNRLYGPPQLAQAAARS
jgi:glycosyltransferase involved in cell wall biosynthesis